MNALTKFSIALLSVAATAIAVYLYATSDDEGFDAARSERQDAICKQDGERLARLRARPSLDEGLRFVGEIRCMQLWPQLQTLLDGLSDPSRSTASSKLDRAASDTTSGSDAALSPGAPSATLDDACKHDEDRLAELRANPSVDAAIRFDSELKCTRLKPQLPEILTQLSHASGSVELGNGKAPASDTMSASAAAPPASEPPASEAMTAASEDGCKQDEERLAALQAKPSLDEAVRFEDELKCSKLQPQLLALLDSLSPALQSAGAQSRNGAPSNTTSASEAVPPTPPASEATYNACKHDEERLAELQAKPSVDEAARFAQELRCGMLRPQLLALTGEVVAPSPPNSESVSKDAAAATTALDTSAASKATVAAEHRIAQLGSDMEALAAKVSRLERDQEGSSAQEVSSTPSPQPATPAERSENQPDLQAAADAERRIAQLQSEKEALTAEVSRLQREREASSAEQASSTLSPQPASPAERSETQPTSQAAADAERRIAQLQSEKEAPTPEVSRLHRDRNAPSSLSAGSGARADRRVALVIGNARYQHAGIVPNVISDANAVAGLLEKAGFDVVDRRSDLGVNEFMRAVSDFAVLSFNADIAVIYFSGFGLAIDDGNYLIAADAKLPSVPDSADEFVPLNWILLAVAARKLNLLIVDACRENPFGRVSKASSDALVRPLGLADVKLKLHNTLIALAAKSGSVSYDGDGPNSPFASAVVKYIRQPGLDIRSALGKVRDEVLRATGNRQEPYVFGSLDAVHVAIGSAEVPNSRSSGASAANEAVPPAPAAEPTPIRETAKDEPANLDVQLEGKPFDTATRRPVEIIEPPKRADTRERVPLAEKAAPPAAVPNSRFSGASTANEAVAPALPVGRAKVGTLTSDETCKRDEDRLVRLRLSPSGEEAQRLASELNCEALRPQVQRLMESLGLVGTALSAPNDLSR